MKTPFLQPQATLRCLINEYVIGLKWIWPYKSLNCDSFYQFDITPLFVFSWLILFFYFLLYFACSHVRGHSITTWAKRGGRGGGGLGDKKNRYYIKCPQFSTREGWWWWSKLCKIWSTKLLNVPLFPDCLCKSCKSSSLYFYSMINILKWVIYKSM